MILAFAVGFTEILFSQDNNISLSEIRGYFEDIKKICNKDNGKLWGVNLWSPIIVIDRKTRTVIATEKDNEGFLTKREGVYTGRFPDSLIIANSIINLQKPNIGFVPSTLQAFGDLGTVYPYIRITDSE